MEIFSFTENLWQFFIMAAVCYAIGCCNFAVIISRWRRMDITKMGSGNPGTMNMTRELGLKFGILTFVCDALKGGIPALISYFIYRNYVFENTSMPVSDFTRYFCGLFVVLGHIFPLQLRFKGGKGIASTLGMFWVSLSCENAWWILLGFGIAAVLIAFIAFTHWGSLASLLGVTACSAIQIFIFFANYGALKFNAYLVATFVTIFLIDALTWWAHEKNLSRLFSGEERQTRFKKSANK